MKIHKSEDRGHVEHGWLNAKHSFSFGEYYNRHAMNFGSLRVLNEDIIAPGQGFGLHSHQNAEIITWVLSGGIRHKDNLGSERIIHHGDVQFMSAGRGVSHSEHNASNSQSVHLYQIWILPHTKGLKPRYEQKSFAPEKRKNTWQLIASPQVEQGSFQISQDAKFLVAEPELGGELRYDLFDGRQAWIQVATGTVEINGQNLNSGDAASFVDSANLEIKALSDSELLLFDLGK